MTDKNSTPKESKPSILEWIRLRLDWIIRFHKFAHIVRFSFWISLLGSIALLATDQSIEILRVIAEDSRHRLLLFSVSVLILSLMSWYWISQQPMRYGLFRSSSALAFRCPRAEIPNIKSTRLPRKNE